MFNPHPFKGSFNDLADIALSLMHRVEQLEVDNEKRKAFSVAKCTEKTLTPRQIAEKEFVMWVVGQPYSVLKNSKEYRIAWLASRGID